MEGPAVWLRGAVRDETSEGWEKRDGEPKDQEQGWRNHYPEDGGWEKCAAERTRPKDRKGYWSEVKARKRAKRPQPRARKKATNTKINRTGDTPTSRSPHRSSDSAGPAAPHRHRSETLSPIIDPSRSPPKKPSANPTGPGERAVKRRRE